MIDRGTGLAVVLLPGIQGRWEWMAPAVDALAKRCRVVTFSLCDEPTSGFRCQADQGFENFLIQIDTVLDRAGLDQAVLIGVSYGGLIATEYAATRPGRVAGLVLASALAPGWQPDARVRFYCRAPWLLSPLFCVTSPFRMAAELQAAFPKLRHRLRFSAGQLARIFRAFLSPSRMARRVEWLAAHRFADPRAVRAPALVITGEDALDKVVSTRITRQYLALLPDVRHVTLAQTGHIGLVTRPHEFAGIVAGFAEEIAACGGAAVRRQA